MQQRLTPITFLFLVTPPILWAGNAIVGRMVSDMVPPITLNFIRWTIAFIVLLPFGRAVFTKGSGLLYNWRRYAVLGLIGIGLYNAMQYMALHTSTPVNVTLVAASMPIWLMIIGVLFFRSSITRAQFTGAILSILGVLLVLSNGDWRHLVNFRFVSGDLIMLLATVLWSFYSWMLTKTSDAPHIRSDWAAFLLAQLFYGVLWSGLFASMEIAVTDWSMSLNATVIFAVLYVAIGPGVIAYRCWGAAVQRVGPSTAGIFFNLTPMFAAVMSALVLGDSPKLYHGLAFCLIAGGIYISTRRVQ